VTRKLHQTIRGVADDVEHLGYNTAIAKLMTYVNVLRGKGSDEDVGPEVAAELVEPLVIMLAPLAPHFSEECWEQLGHETSVFDARWPAFDEELAREDQIELVIQVNGKVRGRVTVTAGIEEESAVACALAEDTVRRFIDARPIRKTVYVPDKLVNLVI
jgi:leucyl-tRNA synthetase